jgi:MFS family permease
LELKGKRGLVLMMFAILMSTFAMQGDSLIIPGADEMFKYYQDDAFVNFLLSGPNLVSMFASIIAGKILQYVDKKKVLMLGVTLFLVGGTLGAAIESAPFMMAMRCLVGLALGFTNISAISIVTSMYIDENIRSRMVGILNGAMYGSAIILTAISGMIAEVYGFKAMFNLYGIGIILLLLIIVFVPKCPPDATPFKSDSADSSPASTVDESLYKGWSVRLFLLAVAYLTFQISYAITQFFNSVYAAEQLRGAGLCRRIIGIHIHRFSYRLYNFWIYLSKAQAQHTSDIFYLVGCSICLAFPCSA